MTKEMFTHEDLPLFSGTPQAGNDPAFTPKDEPQQQTLYTCPVCKDTGLISQSSYPFDIIRCLYCEAGRC